jgi:hypothetical protein
MLKKLTHTIRTRIHRPAPRTEIEEQIQLLPEASKAAMKRQLEIVRKAKAAS